LRKERKIFIIVTTIIFIWFFIGSFLFPPAIPFVIILYMLILFFTGKKEEVITRLRKAGEKIRDMIEIAVTTGTELAKTAVTIVFGGGKIIKGTINEGYKQIGEKEGIKKAINLLGKFTEAGLEIGIETTIVAGKVVVNVSRYAMKRINEEKKLLLDKPERKLLEECVDFVVIDD